MKRALMLFAAVVVLAGVIVAIVAVLNARDPYGGPIEPAAAH